LKKIALVLVTASFIVSGCVPQEAFVKSNMQYSEFERDQAGCETRASQEVAVNRSPGAEVVVAILTGIYQTQDANAAARIRNYEACMLEAGYQRVELPSCKNNADAKKNGVGPLNAQGRVTLSSNTCLARDQFGRAIFHNN
jgi:hypothetical protein